MPDIETRIAEWRSRLISAGVNTEICRELESHLREKVDEFRRSGATETEALERAAAEVGSPPEIASEFKKLRPTLWLPVKITMAIGIASGILVGAPMAASLDGAESFLALGHIFNLTLGYIVALLAGVLGICFVCQRVFSNFPRTRLPALRLVTSRFVSLAAALTACGIILGFVLMQTQEMRDRGWRPAMPGMNAHAVRGPVIRRGGKRIEGGVMQSLSIFPMWAARPPAWPPWVYEGDVDLTIMHNNRLATGWLMKGKAAASVCVLLWLVLVLAVQRSRSLDERGIQLLNILSIGLVGLATLGPFLPPIVLSLVFFLIGLAPERWFRRSLSFAASPQ